MPLQNHLTMSDRRILRRIEVEARTGFKRAHIYNLIKRGKVSSTGTS